MLSISFPEKLFTPKWLFLIVVLFLVTLKTHKSYMGQGSEPHYIVVSESLLMDHDLDLTNNYESPRLREFTHRHIFRKPDGRQFPFHAIGLSLLGVPVLAVAHAIYQLAPESLVHHSQLGSWILTKNVFSFFMMLMAGLMAISFFRLFTHLFKSTKWAWVLALMVMLTPPMLAYGFLFFTELPASLLSLFLFSRLVRKKQMGVLDGLAAGFLPWLHMRYALLAVCLIFARWVQKRESFPLAISVAMWITAFFFSFYMWGAITPEKTPFSPVMVPFVVPAQFFDRSFGLFLFAPIYFFFGSGWFLTVRLHKKLAIMVVLSVFSVLLPIVGYPTWWGGWNPGPRYLTPAIPFLAVCLAYFLDQCRQKRKHAADTLVGLTFFLSILYWKDPRLLWNAEQTGVHEFLLKWFGSLGQSVQNLFPNFYDLQTTDITKLFVMSGVFAIVSLWGYMYARSRPAKN